MYLMINDMQLYVDIKVMVVAILFIYLSFSKDKLKKPSIAQILDFLKSCFNI